MLDYINFLLPLLFIDFIYLTLTGQYQQKYYAGIQKSDFQPNYLAAMGFYLLGAMAFPAFIRPLSHNKFEAAKYGALMGFLMYMTYDLTNKAVFKDYKWSYALMDVAWGTAVFGAASYLAF